MYRTASMNWRLSNPLRPGSPSFPGNSGASLLQNLSFTRLRSIGSALTNAIQIHARLNANVECQHALILFQKPFAHYRFHKFQETPQPRASSPYDTLIRQETVHYASVDRYGLLDGVGSPFPLAESTSKARTSKVACSPPEGSLELVDLMPSR